MIPEMVSTCDHVHLIQDIKLNDISQCLIRPKQLTFKPPSST
jgi:REP element-mobilizing transposase RayT